MYALAGHVAVITHGGSPRGAEIAAAIASHGATVVLYDEHAEQADAAAAKIRHGWGTTAIQIGDAHAEDQTGLVADVVGTCGGLDALILLMDERPLPQALINAALNHLKARDRGLIVAVDPSPERPEIGQIEESLSIVRRQLGQEGADTVRCYGVTALPPGGDLGPAIAHLALTRPDEEFDGRVVLAPPDCPPPISRSHPAALE